MNEYSWIEFDNLNENEKSEILKWRNNDSVRSNMFNCDLINLDDHLRFIKNLEYDRTKRYFMIKKELEPIGVVYLTNINYDENYAEGGLYANPEFIGNGVGKDLLSILLKLSIDIYKLKKIYLLVKKNNLRALKLYQNFDFVKEEDKVDYYIMGKVLYGKS